MTLYKDLIDTVSSLQEISEAIERENDLTVIPELQKDRMMLKYVADQVRKMEDRIVILNRQVCESRNMLFYEYLSQNNPIIEEKLREVVDDQEIAFKKEKHLFTDNEITKVMAFLYEKKIDVYDYME